MAVVMLGLAGPGPADAAAGAARDPVALLVPRATHEALKNELARYREDVEARFPVDLQVCPGTWSSPGEVRAEIRRLRDRLQVTGVVLVGAVPMHRFHMHGSDNPNPLFYEAPGLGFKDATGDGVADALAARPGLELWVANVKCSTSDAEDGIPALRSFFRKTHDYYQGRAPVPWRALAMSSADWPGANDAFNRAIGQPLFGADGVRAEGPAAGSRATLRAAFAQGPYTLFHLQFHSDQGGHYLNDGKLAAADIAALRTGALVTIINGCYACNWARNAAAGETKNAGQSWVFGEGVGQAVIGNVRSGVVYGERVLYERLKAGDYLGRAYFAAKQAAEDEMFRAYPSGEIVSGVILIGNPFLRLTPPAPPAGPRQE